MSKTKSKGKWTRKPKPLELRASVPWKSSATVMSLLTSKMPQYQLRLEEKDAARKRQWMEETAGEVIQACPQEWVDRWGAHHLRKSCETWFNNNRTMGKEKEDGDGVEGGEGGTSDAATTHNKTVAATSKTVLGKAEDNPLAKALRTRKVSPMRLWGSAHNERVQNTLAQTNPRSKIGGWSARAAWIWQHELSDEERAEWTKKASEVDVADDQQCFRNQLGISPLLAGLMTGLIGMSATQIGKAVFSLRVVYRTADGQLMYEDVSLAEGQDSESFIPFAHFEGGNPVEEDERWMRWANQYTAPNPRPCATELLYVEGVARLPEFTGTNDLFWTRKVLRAYFDAQWDLSGNEVVSGWWCTVLSSPVEYVGEEWVADFATDPFELNAAGITKLYLRLYDSEAQGTPFQFKYVSPPLEVDGSVPQSSMSAPPAFIVHNPGPSTAPPPHPQANPAPAIVAPPHPRPAPAPAVSSPEQTPASIASAPHPEESTAPVVFSSNASPRHPPQAPALIESSCELTPAAIALPPHPQANPAPVIVSPPHPGPAPAPVVSSPKESTAPMASSSDSSPPHPPPAPAPTVSSTEQTPESIASAPHPEESTAPVIVSPPHPRLAPAPVVSSPDQTPASIASAPHPPQAPAPTVSSTEQTPAVIALPPHPQANPAPMVFSPDQTPAFIARLPDQQQTAVGSGVPIQGLVGRAMGRRATSIQPQPRDTYVAPLPGRGSSVQPESRRPSSVPPSTPSTPTKRTFTLRSFTPRGARTPSHRMRSESPTREAARRSSVPPPLLLENITEEGDNIEESNLHIPDLASSSISTPVTTVSWLDSSPCDTHPTEFRDLPEEATASKEGPSVGDQQFPVLMDNLLQACASGVLAQSAAPSIPEAREQKSGATKQGRNKTVVPPSTRQLRKRQAADEPSEDAHTSKKPKSLNGKVTRDAAVHGEGVVDVTPATESKAPRGEEPRSRGRGRGRGSRYWWKRDLPSATHFSIVNPELRVTYDLDLPSRTAPSLTRVGASQSPAARTDRRSLTPFPASPSPASPSSNSGSQMQFDHESNTPLHDAGVVSSILDQSLDLSGDICPQDDISDEPGQEMVEAAQSPQTAVSVEGHQSPVPDIQPDGPVNTAVESTFQLDDSDADWWTKYMSPQEGDVNDRHGNSSFSGLRDIEGDSGTLNSPFLSLTSSSRPVASMFGTQEISAGPCISGDGVWAWLHPALGSMPTDHAGLSAPREDSGPLSCGLYPEHQYSDTSRGFEEMHESESGNLGEDVSVEGPCATYQEVDAHWGPGLEGDTVMLGNETVVD